MPGEPATRYRPRRPRESPLYALVDTFYDEVKGRWEEDFERRYGFWRGSVEDAVYAFLDCGIFDRGIARVSCTACRAEYLVAFSCQRHGFCLSCAAKRGALFGAFLARKVVEEVGHCLWTFTIPKMLRVFFLHHRELLGGLCRAGWNVVRELMATAVGDPAFRPGMATVVQTHDDMLGWHPHVHARFGTTATTRMWLAPAEPEGEGGAELARVPEAPEPGAAERRRLRPSAAKLIRRTYEVDPLTCTECGGQMRILAFLLDPAVVRKILDVLQPGPIVHPLLPPDRRPAGPPSGPPPPADRPRRRRSARARPPGG